jgi:hypothetical protein
MRRVLAVFGFSCVLASAAYADHIGLYNDPLGSCNGMVPAFSPTLNAVYVVHTSNAGAAGVQFKVQDQSGMFPVSLTSPYNHIGVWNADWAFDFGGCVIGDHLVATLNFFWFGQPINGCTSTLRVVDAPTSAIAGQIVVADCAFNMEVATGGTFYFEAAPLTCAFDIGCYVTPVRASTWGAVKALYH